MDTNYERKFQEMKKYIPFLDSMIQKLSANSSESAVPRQAQLDKIRSLRDLLLAKKKRLKMENLLKCEQVLINLHAKVEKRETLSDFKPADTPDSLKSKEKDNLEIVRNKLKSVVKLQDAGTLPEIARLHDMQQHCSPGSKEPALFQRRPNITPEAVDISISQRLKSPQPQPKRNYTRRLVSPDQSPRRWSTPESPSHKLYSRRSPQKVKSPTHHKKKKKSGKSLRRAKDLNITLNVPEESLNSLNTEDILSRIITCSDNDVDISTLRELRSQILGELKETGANNDISDLILKSYNKKRKMKKKNKSKKDVEEGEISDSESEAIESIYGSLVVVDKDKKSTHVKSVEDNSSKSRKIQICLVINSEKEVVAQNPRKSMESSEFELITENEAIDKCDDDVTIIDSDTTSSSPKKNISSTTALPSPDKKVVSISSPVKEKPVEDICVTSPKKNIETPIEVICLEEEECIENEEFSKEQDVTEKNNSEIIFSQANTEPECINKDNNLTSSMPANENQIHCPKKEDKKQESENINSITPCTETSIDQMNSESEISSEQPAKFIANFYKPLEEHLEKESRESDITITMNDDASSSVSKDDSNVIETDKEDDSEVIPLLNEPTLPPKATKDVLSEIDILRALKNEILSDTITGTSLDTATPALHQPKLTKVASSKEVAPKNRISIEKYKAKSTSSQPLFSRQSHEDKKKQSLKLTEKECERFNFPKRLSIDDDSSDYDELLSPPDQTDDSLHLGDIYNDLVPQSPDHDNNNEKSAPPVIIPGEPVKANPVSSKADVDMRNLPLLSPSNHPSPSGYVSVVPPPSYRPTNDNTEASQKIMNKTRFNAMDPRIRRELNATDSPNPHASLNSDRTPLLPFPNMTHMPNLTPSMTPTYMPSITPILTPNARSFEMTPLYTSFELDDNISTQKHVYAPSFSSGDNHERDLSVSRDNWDTNRNEQNAPDRPLTPRYEETYKYNNRLRKNENHFRDNREPYTPDSMGWSECPSTPSVAFGRQDPPMTPSHPFGRSECPSTPIHPFGRSDGSNSSFGRIESPKTFDRSECPSTPINPFGRSDCSNSSFGRIESPMTPVHSFGRSEYPTKSVHSIGRSDGSQTPTHPYGRSDRSTFSRQDVPSTHQYNNDHRLYRGRRESSYSENERTFENERFYGRGAAYKSQKTFSDSINYDKRNDVYSRERSERRNDREYGEASDCSSMSKDSDSDRLYTRNRESRYDGRYSRSSDWQSKCHDRHRHNDRISDNMPSSQANESVRSRAPSVGRSSNRRHDDTLYLKSDAGRSLTINTSINTTFQDFIDKPMQTYSFDARRQRAASVGRSLGRENSVASITSSNKYIGSNQTYDDNRKNIDRIKRASSMGRELTQNRTEKSFQEVKADFASFQWGNQKIDQKRNKVERASSVGRVLLRNRRKHIFKAENLKADFEQFKKTINMDDLTFVKKKKNSPLSRTDAFRDDRDGKNYKYSKESYSPTKNLRDPRMYRDNQSEYRSRYKIDNRGSHSRDRHNTGIVYSNDNIAKGTIMGSGFGVKNYKIPKIKRVSIEKEVESAEDTNENIEKTEAKQIQQLEDDKKDKNPEKLLVPRSTLNEKIQRENVKDLGENQEKTETQQILQGVKNNKMPEKPEVPKSMLIDKNKYDKLIESEDSIQNLDDIGNRMTRSKTKMINTGGLHNTSVVRTRRSTTKKTAVLHSDLESETQIEISDQSKQMELKSKENTSTSNVVKQTTVDVVLDSNFGIDDMEMFPENIGSDPVIENINALIADLDNDIDTSKITTSGFNADIEKMIESIDSPEGDSLGDISEVIEKDLNESQEKTHETSASNGHTNTSFDNIITESISTDVGQPKLNTQHNLDSSNKQKNIDKVSTKDETVTKKISSDFMNHTEESLGDTCKATQYNEATVSTSQSGQKPNENNAQKSLIEKNLSTPDSTINQNDLTDKTEKVIADSTNEIHCELSSDVTSTHDFCDVSKKQSEMPKSSQKSNQLDSSLDSIGSLLSILQDKSKIKELLAKLGDKSSENEKLKKKLERLSEIVSDEDDFNDTSELGSKKLQRKELCDTSNQESSETCTVTSHQENLQNYSCDSNSGENSIISDGKEKKIIDDITDKVIAQIDNVADKKGDTLKSFVEKEASEKINEPADADKKEGDGEKLPDFTETSREILIENEEEKIKTLSECGDEREKSLNTMEDEKDDNTVDNEPLIKTKKRKVSKYRNRRGKKNSIPKNKSTLAHKSIPIKKPAKKQSRELKILQDDIKEMFMSDDVLNATGIRMCRLVKMVAEKDESKKEDIHDSEPLSLLKKFKKLEEYKEKGVNKIEPKSKNKAMSTHDSKKSTKDYKTVDVKEKIQELDIKANKLSKRKTLNDKIGPKSKTKQKGTENDPYEFDTESVTDTNTTKESDASSSDTDNDSVVSSHSFESSELLEETKKKMKRKRCAWQSGIIKTKHRKKKEKISGASNVDTLLTIPRIIPDFNCFTDKTYCFDKNVFSYECRLCEYTGDEIVHHYKKQHPHTEIPLSRMNPQTAEIAIKQCEEINFQAISKIPTNKYVCRFCHKEFARSKAALEAFFWHVVSDHTGEYKNLCSECVNMTRCPFNLDIPPPPKDVRGQLIGYICGKCNFTQISLENLKTHVIVRHNDEQTEVYSINLAKLSKKAMKGMLRRIDATENPRTLRTRGFRLNQADTSDCRDECSETTEKSEFSSIVTESSERVSEKDTASLVSLRAESRPEVPLQKPGPMKSKLTFENDEPSDDAPVKIEQEEHENDDRDEMSQYDTSTMEATLDDIEPESVVEPEPEVNIGTPDDIMDYPHFKLTHSASGSKEYVCCINGNDSHYKTALLISMKKHIQMKHSEKWDGYCCLCKVIVTLQGVASDFRDCLTHFLDKHMDNFPILEKPAAIIVSTETIADPVLPIPARVATPVERTSSPTTYIAVRPLAELISKELVNEIAHTEELPTPCPKIENVENLVEEDEVMPTVYPTVIPAVAEITPQRQRPFLYEEFQAEVMSKKHRIVLDAMMSKDKLIRVFKCAGRYCSFTSNYTEDALLHASTHQRVGGEGALNCAYCNFDSNGNAIDLVMHVFKSHSSCQYACSLCFYRASSSQLVGAHHKRVHSASPVTVLRSTAASIAPDANANAGMLSREQAVQHFVCDHDDRTCKFKTYTPGKFIEHLLQRHAEATSHPCNLCISTFGSGQELLIHMKSHGLNLYQCTWCVHGVDNEPALLTHMASCHHNKQPQAYIRVITSKEGSAQMRVLPLAHLNKLKFPTEDITPINAKENPVREAERSIELEELIGHTSQMIENVDTPQSTAVAGEQTRETEEVPLANDETIEPAVLESLLNEASIASQGLVSVLKKEPEEVTKQTPEIICLDSDDEEASMARPAPADIRPPPADTGPPPAHSGLPPPDTEPSPVHTGPPPAYPAPLPAAAHEPHPTPLTTGGVTASALTEDVPITKRLRSVSSDASESSTVEHSSDAFAKNPQTTKYQIFRCPSCFSPSKTLQGFRKHITSCCKVIKNMRCPHHPCTETLDGFGEMVAHYNEAHGVQFMEQKMFLCGLCNKSYASLQGAKMHMINYHKTPLYTISLKQLQNGRTVKVLEVGPADAPSAAAAPPPDAVKYGVGDVDRLPITPIFESAAQCGLCEFSTKVRQNMVRHLRLHAGCLPAPSSQPVNPVPHLETNEMHFDRMVNLAASSGERAAAHHYPAFVCARQRYACGAPGCAYISVDEPTLRRHWEALHAAAASFRCVHCPPEQRVDATKPLSAARILGHFRMHADSLYACSACYFYHFKLRVVERHAAEAHRGARANVVREQGAPPPPPPPPHAAPSMDLKPWRCGLCDYTSMLRPAVTQHCAAVHHSKMQFKCAYCPFRTSDRDNVMKHQANAHATRPLEIIHYYYKDGTVPDDVDGVPRWQKQRQILGIKDDIKAEPEPAEATPGPAAPAPATPPAPRAGPAAATPPVDLNIVKKEVDDTSATCDMSVEDLCKKYGEFCDPNGIRYKCCLCSTVTTQTREEMQAHLFEELRYRRWGCGLCSYKGFHKMGLTEHMAAEHARQYKTALDNITELPVIGHLEKWVSNALDYQTALIERNKQNFAAQAIQMDRPPAAVTPLAAPSTPTSSTSEANLQEIFGDFGEPRDHQFSCPKCDFLVKNETAMRNHMESELTKIRWCCSDCSSKFQTYHEAQFHCKTAHVSVNARPKEALRDPMIRCKWVSAVINKQKQAIESHSEFNSPEKCFVEPEDSLLVARYDEPVPIEPIHVNLQIARQLAVSPQNIVQSKNQPRAAEKRPPPVSDSDDDISLVIDEAEKNIPYKCSDMQQLEPCSYTNIYKHITKFHVLKQHFKLNPYQCPYCAFSGSHKSVASHIGKRHGGSEKRKPIPVQIPLPKEAEVVCLFCEKTLEQSKINEHKHGTQMLEFGKRGDVVVKCSSCAALRLNYSSLRDHYDAGCCDEALGYSFFKLQVDIREIFCCGHCNKKFKSIKALNVHHLTEHSGVRMKYTTVHFNHDLLTECDIGLKRKLQSSAGLPAKRVARKSTSKLPSSAVAKKSTTKLPIIVPDEDTGEYSYYGSKPLPLDRYRGITHAMTTNNASVNIDVAKLGGILPIDPKVVVTDCKRPRYNQ